jgi:hypothetical protein
MRRATAADEIVPLKDPRVQKNPAYLVIILLARVITRLGGMEQINPKKIIEDLFATDLAYLQDLYNEINQLNGHRSSAICPHCQQSLELEPILGGSSATPSIS